MHKEARGIDGCPNKLTQRRESMRRYASPYEREQRDEGKISGNSAGYASRLMLQGRVGSDLPPIKWTG